MGFFRRARFFGRQALGFNLGLLLGGFLRRGRFARRQLGGLLGFLGDPLALGFRRGLVRLRLFFGDPRGFCLRGLSLGFFRRARFFGRQALGFGLGLLLGGRLRGGFIGRAYVGARCRLGNRSGISLGHRRFRSLPLRRIRRFIRMERINPMLARLIRSLQGKTRINDNEIPA